MAWQASMAPSWWKAWCTRAMRCNCWTDSRTSKRGPNKACRIISVGRSRRERWVFDRKTRMSDTLWDSVDTSSKKKWSLPIVSRADGSQVAIPVLVVRGARAGKTLLASAGVHGDEFEGMQAIWQLFDELDPAK